MNKFPMTFISYFDNYECRTTAQKVEWDTSPFKGNFYVSDLCECPEDAIIGRDLFDGDDFIQAVKFGMLLAAHGYTDLAIDDKEIVLDDEE